MKHFRPVPSSCKAITLVELLVASVILVVIVTPICLLFSMSSRTIANARNLTIATSLASSYLTALKKVPVLQESGLLKDTEMPLPYSPEELGVPPADKGFIRSIRIIELDGNGSADKFYRACVTVEWQGTDKNKTQKFSLDAIVSESGGS